MRFKLTRLLIVLASAICVAAGLAGSQLPAANAAPLIPGVQSASSSTRHVANEISVDLKVFNDCAEFRGTLDAYSRLIGKNYETYFAISGTFTERCGGTATLIQWFECGGSSPINPPGAKWTENRGSKTVGYTAGPCSYGISGWVEETWKGSAGYGVGNSPAVGA